MRSFFYKLEVACTLAVIAKNKPGYTVLQSRQKTVVNFSSPSLCVSLSFPACLCLCSRSAYAPPSLSLFTLPLLLSLSLSLSVTVVTVALLCSIPLWRSLSISLNLALSQSHSLGSLFSRLLVSLVCHFPTLSLTVTISFRGLKKMGSTRHASAPLLATHPYLPSFACQTLSTVTTVTDKESDKESKSNRERER